jgi:3-methyladenine DNA glycosylase/8-oxoguanine DNA glycosylase
LTTSASARERIPVILRDMRKRYLPARDLRQGSTALARIGAKTEDPYKVLISTILSQRTRDEMTEVASARLFAKYDTPSAVASAPASFPASFPDVRAGAPVYPPPWPLVGPRVSVLA